MRTIASNRHMKTVHIDQSIKKFLCDQCPFSSHAKRYLEEHNAKEHGKNAAKTVFLCERCKKTFAERGYLQHHICNQGNLLRGIRIDKKTLKSPRVVGGKRWTFEPKG